MKGTCKAPTEGTVTVTCKDFCPTECWNDLPGPDPKPTKCLPEADAKTHFTCKTCGCKEPGFANKLIVGETCVEVSGAPEACKLVCAKCDYEVKPPAAKCQAEPTGGAGGAAAMTCKTCCKKTMPFVPGPPYCGPISKPACKLLCPKCMLASEKNPTPKPGSSAIESVIGNNSPQYPVAAML